MPDDAKSVIDDLSSAFNDLTAAHAFSVMGLRQLPGFLAQYPNLTITQIR